ncbi:MULTISPECIES: GNAT family N-acetyltransferase [unclassified Enterococcus]|jgi:ribosomal-protein-alanine N-acetyltransferase|uniref:GNAT family N-acetyltransferase n=1 Tax=unclassified Enterococcus TaxID=2608891 RepID=UPI003D2E7B91
MENTTNRNLVFAQNQQIETERLLLRPVVLTDAADMYEYANDEETTRFVFPQHQNFEETEYSIANYFMNAPLGKYAIELKETGKMIGTIDLRIEESTDIAEIGYVLNKKYWGKGLVAEAGQSMLTLGFTKLDLVRIFAYHDLNNPNSGRVMEKLHMKKEGIIPDARRWKGEVVSVVMRGITQKEWQEIYQ